MGTISRVVLSRAVLPSVSRNRRRSGNVPVPSPADDKSINGMVTTGVNTIMSGVVVGLLINQAQ